MSPLEQISADLGWRESELGSLKILLSRRDLSPPQRGVLLRAAWAMLYAHYEGFVKTSLTIFYEEVQKRVSKCCLLPRETRAFALCATVKNIRVLNVGEALEELERFQEKYGESVPRFPEIETQSNLWPDLLITLLRRADIECPDIEERRFLLRTLVARRNNIAHGKPDLIEEVEYYSKHEAVVLDIIYNIALGVDERLGRYPYG